MHAVFVCVVERLATPAGDLLTSGVAGDEAGLEHALLRDALTAPRVLSRQTLRGGRMARAERDQKVVTRAQKPVELGDEILVGLRRHFFLKREREHARHPNP